MSEYQIALDDAEIEEIFDTDYYPLPQADQ